MATRFIRVRGRIVPISDKTGAKKGSKRRYPGVKKNIPGVMAAGAALGAGLGAFAGGKSRFAATAIGGAIGTLIGSGVRVTSRAKGESRKHLAARLERHANAKKYK